MEPSKEKNFVDASGHLSPQQRANIEELVRLSPTVIKGRVRREGISAANVLDAYAGVPSRKEESKNAEPRP